MFGHRERIEPGERVVQDVLLQDVGRRQVAPAQQLERNERVTADRRAVHEDLENGEARLGCGVSEVAVPPNELRGAGGQKPKFVGDHVSTRHS